ncbi:hypothetical protein [uncultured Dialister sp.]|uniref:hypothetical protein n=1 Tax=uncultured Dialister sp. TaxID=278064 RepID=UPI00265FD684|nr:hypothetical protein [uncultured Dialister sp.]
MGKRGLGQGVAKHKDPTFEKVLGNFRREARALQEKKKAADAFSCIKALRFYLKMNGYEPADDIVIRDVYTGQIYRSVVPESKRAKAPKY